jgi:hypothetical protein
MKRWTLAVLLMGLLLPAVCFAAKVKEPASDMTNMKSIFIGWVDLGPDAWGTLDFKSKSEWVTIIEKENRDFQEKCASKYFAGKTVTGAKNKEDENAADSELYIKFVNVFVDSRYRLHISVQFIDPKTGAVLASIPEWKHTGHFCTLQGCLEKDLEEFAEKLQPFIMGDKK